MIILGIILLIIGIITVKALIYIGIVVLLIGVGLAISGAVGREIGGRKHFF